MKTLINTLKNCRIAALFVVIAAAMLLVFCETDNLALLIAIKAAGFALAYASYRLWLYWDKKGLVDELR